MRGLRRDAARQARENNQRVKYRRPRSGGAKTIGSDDTLGQYGGCWCGLPMCHDWPGRDDGEPHPREVPK